MATCSGPEGGGSGFTRRGERKDGNQLGVSAGAIFGLKKTRFNNRDFGTIVVPTHAAAN